MRHTFLALLACLASAPLAAQDTPVRIPAPHGEVVAVDEREKQILYDEWHFAPVRVADGIAYVSGIVVGPPREPMDSAAFEASVERVFRSIVRHLEAAGGSAEDIVMLNTFHVFDSPYFTVGKEAHINAFRRGKDRVIQAPYPAWTAIGVEALFPDRGLVEIQVIAHLDRPDS